MHIEIYQREVRCTGLPQTVYRTLVFGGGEKIAEDNKDQSRRYQTITLVLAVVRLIVELLR